MSVEHIEFLVEEPSMETALRNLLPSIIGEVSFEVYAFQCKDEMIRRLPERLKGYSLRRGKDVWFRDCCRIVVVVDRDDDDCHALKNKLETLARQAGLVTRTAAGKKNYTVVNRIAIEELEAWYFGDWEAVRAAYPKVGSRIPSQARYRSADAINGGTWEAFERVLQKVGYFKTGLRKIEAARAVSQHMEPNRNSSPSFRVFRDALCDMR